MWIRKGERDRMMGVDSPIPTQVASNKEFIPPPQTQKQKQVDSFIMEWGEWNARKDRHEQARINGVVHGHGDGVSGFQLRLWAECFRGG
jgi:hypothetical protein